MPVRDRYLNYLHCITFFFPFFYIYNLRRRDSRSLFILEVSLFIGTFIEENVAARRTRRKSWRDNAIFQIIGGYNIASICYH